MAFDLKKFKTAQFKPREKRIPVPQLKEFFDNGAKPVWIIRSLSGEEFYSVQASVSRASSIKEIIEQIFSKNSKIKIEAALEAIGITKEQPDDYVRRLEMLCLGSVDPEIEKEDAVKLARVMPVLFSQMTDEIMILTGAGQELGESKPSGATRKSKTA